MAQENEIRSGGRAARHSASPHLPPTWRPQTPPWPFSPPGGSNFHAKGGYTRSIDNTMMAGGGASLDTRWHATWHWAEARLQSGKVAGHRGRRKGHPERCSTERPLRGEIGCNFGCHPWALRSYQAPYRCCVRHNVRGSSSQRRHATYTQSTNNLDRPRTKFGATEIVKCTFACKRREGCNGGATRKHTPQCAPRAQSREKCADITQKWRHFRARQQPFRLHTSHSHGLPILHPPLERRHVVHQLSHACQ